MRKNTDLKFPVSGFTGHYQRQTILQHLLWFGASGSHVSLTVLTNFISSICHKRSVRNCLPWYPAETASQCSKTPTTACCTQRDANRGCTHRLACYAAWFWDERSAGCWSWWYPTPHPTHASTRAVECRTACGTAGGACPADTPGPPRFFYTFQSWGENKWLFSTRW